MTPSRPRIRAHEREFRTDVNRLPEAHPGVNPQPVSDGGHLSDQLRSVVLGSQGYGLSKPLPVITEGRAQGQKGQDHADVHIRTYVRTVSDAGQADVHLFDRGKALE